MPTVKQALKLSTASKISFDVPETGVIASAIVSVFDHAGAATAIAADSVDSVNGRRLEHTVEAAVIDEVGTYRALWQYTVGAQTAVQHSRMFEVVRHVLRPSLNGSLFLTSYYPSLRGNIPQRIDVEDAVLRGWDEIFAFVEASGAAPHRIIDGSQLEQPHADFVAAHVYRNMGPEFVTMAESAWTLGRERLRSVLGTLRFYDADEDLLHEGDEIDAGVRAVTALRG